MTKHPCSEDGVIASHDTSDILNGFPYIEAYLFTPRVHRVTT
jgi:hypothetical protein